MNIAGVVLSTELCYAVGLGGVFFIMALIFIINRWSKDSESNDEEDDSQTVSPNGDMTTTSQDEKKKKGGKATLKQSKASKKESKFNFQHKWLASVLKGHGATVLDFDLSPNGKYLVSCDEDRICHMWSTKQLMSKEHKFVKGNVEYDHLTCVRFSPDSKAFLGSLCNQNTIRIFKITKKDDGGTQFIGGGDFPNKYKEDIINIGIASNGRFVMTCHSDTTIKIWDLKGDCLSTIDTRQMYNAQGAVSPCGRFVGSCGFTSDVKVWEIVFSRSGTFKEVKRAFELVGHNAGVLAFDFNADSTRMATCSKDGTWRLWDTNIEYAMGQDPYLLKTFNLNSLKTQADIPVHLALAPNSISLSISLGKRLLLLDTETGEGEDIEEVHSDNITAVHFDTRSRFLITSGGNRLNVLHNVVGLKARERQLTELHRTASTQGAKERYQGELKTIQEHLVAVGSTQ